VDSAIIVIHPLSYPYITNMVASVRLFVPFRFFQMAFRKNCKDKGVPVEGAISRKLLILMLQAWV
jgi:hypothetical protein